VVISVRVRKELKEELERLGIDYAEAVQRFLEELVARERRRLALEKAREVREKLRSKVGTLSPSAELIREDRDAGHCRVGVGGFVDARGRRRGGGESPDLLPALKGSPLGGSLAPSPGLQRPLGPRSWGYPGQHRGSRNPLRGLHLETSPFLSIHPRPKRAELSIICKRG